MSCSDTCPLVCPASEDILSNATGRYFAGTTPVRESGRGSGGGGGRKFVPVTKDDWRLNYA